jgi:chitin synthase
MPSPQPTISSVDAGWRKRQTIKRGKTKRVKLQQGNFITEYAVPTAVQNAIEARWKGATSSTEFTHMRYTAATCDPDEFTRENGWTFRQVLYNRPTELLIAVTSYNEVCKASLGFIVRIFMLVCRTRSCMPEHCTVSC